MFCTHCGAPVPGGAKFCPACGAPAQDAPAQTAAPQPTSAPQPIQTAVRTAQAAGGISSGAKLLIVLLLIGIVGGGGYILFRQATADPDAGIKATVAKLEQAYGQGDINGMLDCFDPAYAAIYKGAVSLVGSMVGFDISDTVAGLFGLAAVLPPEATGGAEIPKLSLTVNSVNYTAEDAAEVGITAVFTQGGSVHSEEHTVQMIRKDGAWYFSGEGLFQ